MINLKPKNKIADIHAVLLGMIAHDVKVPLESLAAYIGQIRYSSPQDQEYIEMLQAIESQVRSSATLLDTMLNWTKIHLTSQKRPTQSILLRLQTDMIIITLKNLILNREYSIRNNIEHMPQVNVNVHDFEFVMRNLLINSIKFNAGKAIITVSSVFDSGKIQLCVSDNGVGIAKKQLSNLFEFSNNKINDHGSGLGLILCKNCVERNGGKIWAENNADGGSSFYFTLPLRC